MNHPQDNSDRPNGNRKKIMTQSLSTRKNKSSCSCRRDRNRELKFLMDTNKPRRIACSSMRMFWISLGFTLMLLIQCVQCQAVQQGDAEGIRKLDNNSPTAGESVLLPRSKLDENENDRVGLEEGSLLLADSPGQSNLSSDLETTTSRENSKKEDPNDKSLKTLAYWINAVLTNIIVILGTVGNSLTIIILTRRAMRSSTNIYLSALAVWDIVVLICTALLIGIEAIPQCGAYRNYAYAYVVSYIYPLALIAQTATIWLTVSFTVERFIAVCHPLKAARMCTIKRAKIVIFGVSLGSTLYNIPRWFEYKAVKFFVKETNQTINVVDPTSFVQNPWYTQIYFSWLYVPIMCIIPLVTLAILNSGLVLAVRRSQKQRKDMNVRQSRENNVTIMLASVVVVFILCQVPALVYNLAYAIDREYVEQRSFGYRVLSIMRNFLVAFNSAINFLLYCALGQKFRRIFLHTFCKKCINDTYMPMSGIHQHVTSAQFAGNPHHGGGNPHHYGGGHKGARQYYANSHAMMVVRNKGASRGTGGSVPPDGITQSSTATTTTVVPNCSQESALIDPPTLNKNDLREVRTYTTSRGNKNRVASPGTATSPIASASTATVPMDSDTEGYDVALEHLLTSTEKSNTSLTSGYQQPSNRPKLFGIKNSVPVT